MSDEHAREEHPPPRGFGCGVDLQKDGLLHLINREVFHPRGYALGFSRSVSADDATPSRPQFVLMHPGWDGEPVRFADDLDAEGRDLPTLAEAAFKRAAEHLYEFTGWPFTDQPEGDVDSER